MLLSFTQELRAVRCHYIEDGRYNIKWHSIHGIDAYSITDMAGPYHTLMGATSVSVLP